MHIQIINGSPKGERSITLKTVQYLSALHPEHTFDVIHAGAQIRSLERDFGPALAKLEQTDLLLFSYPVYTFLAPAQLHRFIELMQENSIDLTGKAATQITTSKRFYDITAHTFVEENLLDFGARVYDGLSADMEDLLSEEGRAGVRSFFDTLMFQTRRQMGRVRLPRAASSPVPYTTTVPPVSKRPDRTVALLSFVGPEDTNLKAMIDGFDAACLYPVRRFAMKDFPYQGGCLGCLRCAQSGQCIYTDGFQELLRDEIERCDATIFAFPVKNHFTYHEMKMYNDRQFCNGHRTTTAGSPVGYIISGPYGQEANLQTVVHARAAVGENYLAGVATDETDPQKAIADLAASVSFALETNAAPQRNFYGAGGTKIFRDLVYKMQGIMQADHQFFKSHGLYDFPQKDKKTLLGMKAVGMLMRMPRIGPEIQKDMDKYMLAPYEEVIAAAQAPIPSSTEDV